MPIRPGRRLKILLTEGSSLSARHTVSALAALRPVIDACDPNPLTCMVRASLFVRTCHRAPSFAGDPAGYLQFLLHRLHVGRYDVLLPVHDQVFLVARFRDLLANHVGLAVSELAALRQLQSKVSFVRLLAALHLPHPATAIMQAPVRLNAIDTPCYFKLAYSTAGRGVWFVKDPEQARETIRRLETDGRLGAGQELLIQQPGRGTLCVAQSVFQHGTLVAAHSYQARALGVGGSAWARVSVVHPIVREHLSRLGAHLHWHGALMLDYLYDHATGQPAYIEANPRIGETMNAKYSGLNLPALLTEISLGHTVALQPPGRSGTRTHNLLTRLLALGQTGATRPQMLAELARALSAQGDYADSEEELLRLGDDPPSLLPLVIVGIQLLLKPRNADRIVQRAVDQYALTEATVQAIERMELD